MRLDDEGLRRLAGVRDPEGVLSVYVDVDPALRAAAKPRWAVTVKNELAALTERLKREGSRRRWILVQPRLEESDSEISALLDPAQSGRSRALFVPMSGRRPIRLTLNVSLVDRVVLGESPYVRPLVAALEQGRAAGLVTASKTYVGVHEISLGETQELIRRTFEESTGEWREFKGPAPANPAIAQQTALQRDRFDRRVEDRRRGFLTSCAEEAAALADSRAWELVVVAGNSRLTRSVVDVLAATVPLAVEDGRSLDGPPTRALADVLAPVLERARERWRIQLVGRAAGAALAGGPGTLGLGDTLAALAAGRVEHLLLVAGRGVEGIRTPGALEREGAIAPGAHEAEITDGEDLDKRMIKLALESDARVTLLEGGAAEPLSHTHGIAALLRW